MAKHLALAWITANALSAAMAAPGDQWILPIALLNGDGWIEHPGAGYGGSSAWQGTGQDGVRRVIWSMDQPGLPDGTALYRIEFFYPSSGPGDWQPIESQFRGSAGEIFPMEPLIPWAGSYGTNHQWIGAEFAGSSPGTWTATGPGPHTPEDDTYSAGDAGIYMWLRRGSMLYAKWDFSWPIDHTWAELRVTQVTQACPEITAVVSGGATLCKPAPRTITVTVTGGVPPYTVTLSNGGGTLTGPSPLAFVVTPTTRTTYTAISAYDANNCVVSTSGSATINIFTPASTGPDQIICPGATTAPLGGSTPTLGVGSWSVVSGGTGSFAPRASAPDATFTHTGGAGPITLRWNITSPMCTPSNATMTVTVRYVAADLNRDCAVDHSDFAIFAACATGPRLPYNPLALPAGCTLAVNNGRIAADLDSDVDVDMDDFAVFQRCYRGSFRTADPHCAD